MNHKYRFYEGAFDHFLSCAMEMLEWDIKQSQVNLIGKTKFRNVREANTHQGCLDRLEVLMLIDQLRKDEITRADFNELVKITK